MSNYMKYANMRGLVPNWVWYQINGQSAQQNWMEQRQEMVDRLAEEDDADDVVPHFTFTSEVKIK